MSYESLSETQIESWIRVIRSGGCPLCDRVGLKIPARHIALSHGIGRGDLNEMLNVPKTFVLCDPSVSDNRREIMTAAWGDGRMPKPGKRSPESRLKQSKTFRRRYRRPDSKAYQPTGRPENQIDGAIADGVEHGTYNAYSNHKCRCGACRDASYRFRQGLRKREPPSHGVNGYKTYACRCDVCSEAFREWKANHR